MSRPPTIDAAGDPSALRRPGAPVLAVAVAGVGAALSLRHGAAHVALAVLALACVVVVRRWRGLRFPALIPIVALVLWQFLSEAFGPHPGDMLRGGGITYHWLVVPILATALIDVDQWYRLLRWWSVGLVAAAALCALQFAIGVDRDAGPWRLDWGGEPFDRTVGFQSRPWNMAYLFGLGLILFLPCLDDARWWRAAWVRRGILVACAAGLLSTQIRAPLIATAVALAVWAAAMLRPRAWQWAAAAAIAGGALAALFVARGNALVHLLTLNSRTRIWSTCLDLVERFPLFGCGRPHFERYYQEAYPARNPDALGGWSHLEVGHAHQDYLGLAVAHGLPALLCYLAILASLVIWALRIRATDPRTAWWLVALVAFAAVAGLAETYLDYSITCYATIAAYTLVWRRHALFAADRELTAAAADDPTRRAPARG